MTGIRPSAAPDADVWDAAATVVDPEIPVLSIADLGILREAYVADGRAVVVITPTYSGCPAMETISANVRRSLADKGFPDADVQVTLTPAWTTEWMTDAAKIRLAEFGIAPPTARPQRSGPIPLQLTVRCPRCGSTDTRELAHFGSTSCKALYQCGSCAEPFDYFKVL